jgi:hypothetical protein
MIGIQPFVNAEPTASLGLPRREKRREKMRHFLGRVI